ncbi:hypothetical protein AKO1_004844 [Acrasis kona]|uniref:Uncharacterized protein n=1 Tax=Acrasis kona TaxID=1008807 RepID=A0AAW2Z6G7_9EUKA
MTRSSWYAIALLLLIEFVLSANYTSLHSRTVGADNGLSLFGVFIESDVWTGLGQTISVEQRAGRVVNIVNWFQNWGQPFQKYVFDNVFNKNKIPLLTWEPWIPERGPNQPD